MTTARATLLACPQTETVISGVFFTKPCGAAGAEKNGSAKPISPRQARTCLLRKALSNKQELLLSPGLRPGGVSQPFLISYTLAQSEITNQAEKETALSRGGCNLLPPMES